CVEQDDKGWDARKRAYCLKIQPATGSFARNLIYSTKPQRLVFKSVFFDYCNSAPIKNEGGTEITNNLSLTFALHLTF
ncbi:hypothetical protein AB8T07_21685, partial [Klebsiella pneumoniae]|uniref:hypothetical protein n=1 Tax=Klebsiella pneumoniae TaxID=573 RepID=UPI0021F270EB